MADDISIVIGVDSAPVDRAVRVMDNLEAEVRDVERAFKSGLITEKQYNAETARLAKSMDRLKTVAKGSAKDFRAFEKVVYGSGKALRAKEVQMQQAGYQLQDFIVQVQAGTNPLIAFSQQGSQLAGFFAGPWGAAIGLGIAALGGLGTVLLGTKDKAKDLTEQVEDLADAFATYTDILGTNAIAQVNDQFGQTSSILVQIQRDLNNLAKTEAMNALEKSAKAVYEEFQGFRSELELISNMFGTRTLSKDTAYLRDDIRSLSNESLSLGERIETALDVRQTLLDNAGGFENLSQKQLDFYNNLTLVVQRMEQARLLMEPSTSGKTGYEGEFEGVMDFMATQTVQEIQSGYEAVQRVQAGIAKAEAKRMSEAEAHNDRMIALQNAHKVVNKAVADEQQADQDQLYHNALLAKQDAMAQDITAEKDRQKLADQTHAHMMALQNAFYADAKKQAGEVAAATYLANYNAALAYMAYGESRMAAPSEPVKPKKEPRGRTKRDPLADLQKQVELEQALIGKTQARQRIIQALGVDFMKYGQDTIASLETQINKTIQLEEAERKRQEAIEEAKRQQEELKDSIESSMSDAFMSIIDGTKSVEDAFRDMARQIIAELMRVLVVKQMVSAATGFFGFANGGVFQGGSQVQAYANGGVVGSPTYFPMAGGKTGLMGEAGPEAIMPLKRGKDGKLGVAVDGNQQQSVVINQSFNFAANGDDSVKRIIASEAPKIAKMTEAQILDNRRRGGQFRKAFS